MSSIYQEERMIRMDVQIRLGDLGLLLLGIALLILLIYGILVLKNVYESIVKIRKIIEKNETHIDEIIQQTSSITSSLKDVGSKISGDVKSAQKFIDQITAFTETAAGSIAKNLLTIFIAILQIAYIMKNLIFNFPKQKK